MNTKSVVAAVKKPKVAKAAKAVVKKPKAVPKATKATKVVVKKPKAVPKVAKAVPKVAKAAKATKAVVKKPRKYNNINGGVGSGRGSTYSVRLSRKSNAVVDEFPQIQEETQPLSPRILLKKILDGYKEGNILSVYHLILLINNMAENLNKFFENLLLYYPNIILRYPDDYKKKGVLNYQQYHLDILKIIVAYVRKINYNPSFLIPYNPNIYSVVLDGKEYRKGKSKFFHSYKLEDLPEHIIIKLQGEEFTFGDIIIYNVLYNSAGKYNEIAIKLNLILQLFFVHIYQYMEIQNQDVLDEETLRKCEKYINEVKKAALEYYWVTYDMGIDIREEILEHVKMENQFNKQRGREGIQR
jgi:hypothetical protein